MHSTNAERHPVPVELVVDFDAFQPAMQGSDPFLDLQELQKDPGIVWTPHNGGHWIATRGEIVKAIPGDSELFSSSSIMIAMPNREPLVPAEFDPPHHGSLRKSLMLASLPENVGRPTIEARELAIALYGPCNAISPTLLRTLDLFASVGHGERNVSYRRRLGLVT